jgi:universal stress protein A
MKIAHKFPLPSTPGVGRVRRILAAVDASEDAPEVLDVAADVATRFGASLFLLNVLWIPRIPAARGLDRTIARRASERLKRLAAAFPHSLVEETQVVESEPWQSIVATAERLNADLIVVSDHGYSVWDQLLGSTAASVATRAHSHVWVVHQRSGGTVEA